MALTASDGTGLQLVALEADAVVDGPLAFTELRLTFQNPLPRRIEGRFAITLPEGAALSRFAMKIGNRWQEGEVVEKEAARRAYEDFLHRKQDPALLEQGAGNEFTARVFPIEASGQKQLIVSYSHEVGSSQPYTLPLRGLPRIERLETKVYGAGGKEEASLKKRGWIPNRDLVAPRTDPGVGIFDGRIVVLPVVPVTDDRPDEVNAATFLLDTSASRALDFVSSVELLEQLIAGLAKGRGPNTPVQVAVFDQEVEVVFSSTAGAFGAKEKKRILRRRALGGSDLGRALKWAASSAKHERLFLLSDGVPTVGPTDVAGLRNPLAALAKKGRVKRLDAVALGGNYDRDVLTALTTGGLARDGAVVLASEPAARLAHVLTHQVRSGLAIDVAGARWVWPNVVDGVSAGDEVLVYAQLDKVASSRWPRVTVDGKVRQPVARRPAGAQKGSKGPALRRGDPLLLSRALVKADLDRLEALRSRASDKKEKAKLKARMVELSVAHRVLCAHTALLVLETEDDYKRYNIGRKGLVDILVVERGRLNARHRTARDLPPPKPKPKPAANKPRAKKKAKKRDRRPREAPAQDSAPGDADDEFAEADKSMAEESKDAESEMSDDVATREEVEREPPPPPAPEPESRPAPRSDSAMAERREQGAGGRGSGERGQPKKVDPLEAYEGPYKDIKRLLLKGKVDKALARASGWRDEDVGNVMALTALGEALEAKKRFVDARRAYGSIVDLFPGRADLRRYAGQRLEALAQRSSAVRNDTLELARDVYEKAREQRPDHPSVHHLLGFVLVKLGRFKEALDVVGAGLERRYPDGRFAEAHRILAEDLGLIAAAWKAKGGAGWKAEQKRMQKFGKQERGPSVRFILTWETDANDVDFHIYDAKGGHAYYSSRELASGGSLYADVTTGYGPECFTIRKPRKARKGPYRLQAHYYSRGPMGYGMGKLQVIEHDGRGGLTFTERPYVVMKDGAYLDLGTAR